MRVRLVLVGAARMTGMTMIGSTAVGACATGPSDVERTSSVVCEELRAHDGRLVDLVNASVAGISTLPADERSIPDREVQGAVGEWFNSVEKVMSVSEPQIFRFDRQEFTQAFLDEPACRHVIQQFVDE